MTLRHTATLTFNLRILNDLGLTSQLGLSDHVKIGENELSRSWDVSKSLGSRRFERAYNRMVWDFRNAVMMATGLVRIELDLDTCDALTAILAQLRIDGGSKHAESKEFIYALRYVQTARENLVETADAWRDSDHLELETIYFTKYESAEITHWMEINDCEVENGRRNDMTETERHADIRLHDQFARMPDHLCLTGDLGTFRALRTTMEEAQEVALDRDELGHECADLRYLDLMGKIDDAISSLETLDSDQQWRRST